MKTRIPHLYFLLIALLAMAGFQSCTKTAYTDYEAEIANRILEYRVTNSQQELMGAIDNENNTITVYIPYYQGIDYLNAEIKLDEGATLLDSTGTEINLDGGLDPVKISPDSVRVKYTVVPATGDKRTYTLIQKILPYPQELEANYATIEPEATEFSLGVNFRFDILGDFQSTNIGNIKFILKNKETGEINEDWIKPLEMVAGNDALYTLTSFVKPEALAGKYEVKLQHQGRTGTLPDLNLVYTRSRGGNAIGYTPFATSTANFAPGDTVTFAANEVWSIGSGYDGGIFLPIDRAYLKVKKTIPNRPGFSVPTGFPEELFEQELDMKIVSQTRTELKVIFPELPAGTYSSNKTGSYDRAPREDGRERLIMTDTNFGVYVDWADETGWEKDFLFIWASSLTFTVNSK